MVLRCGGNGGQGSSVRLVIGPKGRKHFAVGLAPRTSFIPITGTSRHVASRERTCMAMNPITAITATLITAIKRYDQPAS